MGFEGLLGRQLRLLRMLLEPLGKLEMFPGRVFPKILNSFTLSPSGKQSLIKWNSHFLGIPLNAAVKWTNSRYKGCFNIEYIPSVVPQFFLNPFCSLDSCVSYHDLIRFKMILMISLHTVDPELSPLYLLGSDFDPFPFQRVLSLELPQTAGISRFDHSLFAILSIT